MSSISSELSLILVKLVSVGAIVKWPSVALVNKGRKCSVNQRFIPTRKLPT